MLIIIHTKTYWATNLQSFSLLASVARLEHRSVHRKISDSVSSQSTYPGRRFKPLLGCVQGAASQCFFLELMFLSVSCFLPLFLKSIRISSLSIKKKTNVKKFFFSDCGLYHYRILTINRYSLLSMWKWASVQKEQQIK